MLERIEIAAPCTARWEAMVGDERVRFCGDCQKHVYNLSAMARNEAERVLTEREGSVCVRLYQRADGTVLTADCPVGARKRRVRRRVYALAGDGALAGAGALAAMVAQAHRRPGGELAPATTCNTAAPEEAVVLPPPQPAPPAASGKHLMGGASMPRRQPPSAPPGKKKAGNVDI